MDAAAIIDVLRTAVPGASYEAGTSVDFPTIYVLPEHLVGTCFALRDEPSLRFEAFIEGTAVDYLPRVPRFEVVYHLLSVTHRRRVRLKVRVLNATAAEAGVVPTLQAVWPGSGWPEREMWDMFGIVFTGHEDLRRLLMPEDWEGHPGRKDYPVQIQKSAQTYAPLEVSEEQFRANLERDRVKRGRA
jgi:NADH-quinone oxidoreductase subunit C